MRRLSLLAGAIVASCLSTAALAGPTDAEVDQLIADFNAWGERTDQATMQREFPAKLREMTDTYPVKELTADQIGELGPYLLRDGRHVADAVMAAESQASKGGADGAVGEVVAAWLWMRSQRVPPDASELKAVLDHEGLDDALAAGRAFHVYEIATKFGQFRTESEVRPHLDSMATLLGKLPADGQYEFALLGAQLYETVSKYSDDAERNTALRGRVVESLKAAKEKASERRIADAIEQTIRKIGFIGGPTPEIAFAWTSDGLNASSLEDLKGNVVVLDFWATWCGPCIAAFPKVRDLVEHYEGYPVKVIGVTGIQGRHKNPDGSRVDTRGNPQREFELMESFMSQKDMTWPVAFAASNEFNTDYFITGIPHLAFIAPDGTIRHNGLNPHMISKEEEHEIIDSMLREFGLPTPSDHAEEQPEG